MRKATERDVEELYRSRHVVFRGALTGIVGSVEAGDDAMHEGFARALVNLEQFRGDGSLEAWVWRICVNEARAGLRKRRIDRLDDDVQAASTPDRDPAVVDAIRRLSPRRRLIVFLRYYADLSYEEIAAATGMRMGTVAATLTKARAELYEMLEVEEVVR